MMRRQHVVSDFFQGAEAMREALDLRFKDPYTHSIDWHYFCDPRMYAYLRADPQRVFPKPIFERFLGRLRLWCMENLGLAPMNRPSLHMMVNGCRLNLHSDFHNGTWGYVYSLTRWDSRTFSGGETLLLRDGVPSYKKHHVHGEVLYELFPAYFNQLLIFDDRIVHATPTIEGSMDPMAARIALVGHIRATSPVVDGSIPSDVARRVILGCWPDLRERIGRFRDVQGTVTYRLSVDASGVVESVTTLTDNLVTSMTGYQPSDAVSAVKSLVQSAVAALRFPATDRASTIVVPVLIPIPDQRPIEMELRHDASLEMIRDRIAAAFIHGDELGLKGAWKGDVLAINEPIAGTIRVDRNAITFHFDAPMWVPSQRESFQQGLVAWAKAASANAMQ